LTRGDIAARLRVRRQEIEAAILPRLDAIAGPTETEAPEYRQGLRRALGAAVEFGIAAIESGEERSGLVPAEMLAQARQAARSGVELEVVLRRYAAGYTILCDFLMQEARERDVAMDGATLYDAQRELAALFDRIVARVAAEYRDELSHKTRSFEQLHLNRLKRLLAGELVDTSGFDYDFDGWHVGILASGRDSHALVKQLASVLDRRLLYAEAAASTLWAWLGARHEPAPVDVTELTAIIGPGEGTVLAIGEPRRGLGGWRLTHRQAKAALSVARSPRPTLVPYRDVAFLAAVLGHDDLVDFLVDAYLAPLEGERDGGAALRETLGAYLAAGRQVSSAACALGVARKTVTKRLRVIEERIGRPLDSCAAEIEMALRLVDHDPQIVGSRPGTDSHLGGPPRYQIDPSPRRHGWDIQATFHPSNKQERT
jgi:hypothetical protein